MDCIVLDAMGVVFQAADDVAELLVPFVKEHGGENDEKAILAAYLEASLGSISPDEFWHRVELDPGLEDSYLSLHKVTRGLNEFLATAKDKGIPVWLLSNDVGRWSEKLRHTFDLSSRFQGAIISSDARCRKPDNGIYDLLIQRSGFTPSEMLFFDDREKNIWAAGALGIPSVLFHASKGFESLAERLRADAL